MKKNKKLVAAGCIIGFLATCGIIFGCLWKVTPLVNSFIIELGENVSAQPGDYFSGMAWSVEKAKIDLSEVVLTEPGSYFVYGRHGFETYTFTVIIQDTTPPEITEKIDTIYLQTGNRYTPYDLIDTVTDISGNVDLQVEAEGQDSKYLSYQDTGIYTVTVKATDPSGNIAKSQVTFLVDTPPEITGIPEVYAAEGSEVSLAELAQGVAAYDEVDGELTEQILIDASAVDWNTEGEYQVIYSVADGYGLLGVGYSNVYVLSADQLQEAINTHRINRFDQIIEGAYNLYDAGYYEEDDPEFIMETMEPALVRINISETIHGSGFIIEITDDSIMICTNQHVVTDKKTLEVCFHNGVHAWGNVIAGEERLDIGFIEVPFDNITPELLDSLFTVHIDMDYWNSLENRDPISLCMRTLNEDGSVWHDRTGTLAQKIGEQPEFVARWYPGQEVPLMTEVYLDFYTGCSGSAILDGHGNMIAMAAAVTEEDDEIRNWAVLLSDIINYYEEVMGRAPNYQ